MIRISTIRAMWARNVFGDAWMNRKIAYGQIVVIPERVPNPVERVVGAVIFVFLSVFKPYFGLS